MTTANVDNEIRNAFARQETGRHVQMFITRGKRVFCARIFADRVEISGGNPGSGPASFLRTAPAPANAAAQAIDAYLAGGAA